MLIPAKRLYIYACKHLNIEIKSDTGTACLALAQYSSSSFVSKFN